LTPAAIREGHAFADTVFGKCQSGSAVDLADNLRGLFQTKPLREDSRVFPSLRDLRADLRAAYAYCIKVEFSWLALS
jgi:hypothetical protein